MEEPRTGLPRPSAQRRPGRPTRDDAAALPDRILDAAEGLFLKYGYEATSLSQIAACVGATKRTLYVKIGDKAELFAAVVRRLLERKRARLSEGSRQDGVAERLTRFGQDLLAIALDPQVLQLYRLVVAEAGRFPELATLMEEQTAQGVQRRLARLLTEEVAEGRLALDDPADGARRLSTMIIGWPQREVLFGGTPWDASTCRAWAGGCIALFLSGAATGPHAGAL